MLANRGRTALFLGGFLLTAGILACSEEIIEPPPPPPPPPPVPGRPVDPGLTFNVGCVHDGPVDLPLTGGGSPPGSIPALVNPAFLPVDQADYLFDRDLVHGVEIEGRFYAFPARILNYHEIVTFNIGEGRYAATWCPLSYSFVMVENANWDATTSGRIASFIVSGALMDNNLVIVDLETSTSWPQILLKGISGDRTGDCLTFRRTGVATTWEFWKTLHPETVVLTNQNEFQTSIPPSFYFTNPYEEYWKERIDPPTWPVTNLDSRLPKQEIVLGVHGQNGRAAVLVSEPVARVTIGDTPVVFFHHGPSGTTVAFENRLDGTPRTFLEHDLDENGFPTFKDTADGSVWDIEGIAIEGPQRGRRLARMPAVQVYWFVWATFFPGSPIHKL